MLQGLRGCRAVRRSRPRARRRDGALHGAARRAGGRHEELAAVHDGGVGTSGHGDVHRGRRLRHRRVGGAGRARSARLRPQRRGHAQLRRRRARHPQLGLLLPWRGHHEHPQFPGRLPGRRGRPARAELPLDADDPQRRQRGHHPQPRADGEVVWTDLGEGDPVKVRELDDEHAEARFVVGEIERLVDEGVSRAEIAIFYRTNAQSRVLEDTLVRREIGYQIIGGTKFYERAEIKDAIAYLTVLSNPQDVISFTRVANSPKRGIGQTSLSRVLATRRRWAWRCGTRPPTRARCRGSAPRPCGPSSASWPPWPSCASAWSSRCRSATCSTRSCTRPATSTGSRPSARSRRRGASRTSRSSSRSPASSMPAPRTTRSTSSSSRSRWSPTPTPAATTRAS